MGTLFQQSSRWDGTDSNTGDVGPEELDRVLSELDDFAKTYEMPFSDVLATYKMLSGIHLDRERFFAQIRDWDTKDEQLAGFGKIAKQFSTALAAFAKGDRTALEELSDHMESFEERFAGMTDDPCKYPRDPT